MLTMCVTVEAVLLPTFNEIRPNHLTTRIEIRTEPDLQVSLWPGEDDPHVYDSKEAETIP